MVNFCHISPIQYLDLVKGRPVHLVLAHLIERDITGISDGTYTKFYREESERGAIIILDNSIFELYKAGRPAFNSDKLIPIGRAVQADYIVLSDYPGEPGQKTIDACEELIPQFKSAGFKVFFVPQSQIGDLDDYVSTFSWAANNSDIDLIGVSILGVPNAFGVERNNKLQRYLSRYSMMSILDDLGELKNCNKRLHFLGMVDGPKEIELVKDYHQYIYSWDSSAAVWAGLNEVSFDTSPTGLIDGKFELEVDFDLKHGNIDLAVTNIKVINNLVSKYTI